MVSSEQEAAWPFCSAAAAAWSDKHRHNQRNAPTKCCSPQLTGVVHLLVVQADLRRQVGRGVVEGVGHKLVGSEVGAAAVAAAQAGAAQQQLTRLAHAAHLGAAEGRRRCMGLAGEGQHSWGA